MSHSREFGSESSHRNVRKRPRDDYEDGQPRYFPKRGRFSDPGPGRREEALSPQQRLESLISRLGEKSNKSLENNLETLAQIVTKEISEFKDTILKTICKCVCTLSERTTLYSTLVGILNAKKYDFGEELLDMLIEELKSALLLMQFSKAKQLVRFLADLVNTKVVASSSILALFEAFIMVAYEPDIPMVRADCYVNMVLSSLPWVGAELDERKRQETDRVFAVLEGYMVKRTTPYLPAFQSWSSDEPHLQSDFLEVLWVQVKAMREKDWKEHVLLRPYRSMDALIGGAYSHALPNITIPPHSENSVYPLPTVVFRFFTNDDLRYEADPGCVLPANESIDRYLIEDAIQCIVTSHTDNRKECANSLIQLVERMTEKSATPMNYIIVEVLFGYLLQLPAPPTVPVYYSSVFIELCKLNPASYPRILEQIVKLLFSHLDKMNMVSVNRLAQWFAHHLSNFKFTWNWVEWVSVLQGRKDHPSVYFVSEIFTRCIRLGCYDDFVEMVPAEFTPLLPAEPAPQFKYNSEDEAEAVPDTEVATKLVDTIRDKKGDMEGLSKIIDSLPSVNPELSFNRNKLTVAKVSVLTHCILHVGSKTVSHCILALTKFKELFMELLVNETAKTACLESVAEFYSTNTLMHCLVVDKMMRMQILDAMTVLNWFFSSKVTPLYTRQYIWDILESTILKTNRAHIQATKDLAETEEKLKKVSDLDEVAMGSEDKQKLEEQVVVMEDKVMECLRTQKDMFLIICQRMIAVITEHLTTCDQEGVDYETTWFFSTIDHFRQILFQNYTQVSKYSSDLKSLAFTLEVDSRIMEVFQQFQALL